MNVSALQSGVMPYKNRDLYSYKYQEGYVKFIIKEAAINKREDNILKMRKELCRTANYFLTGKEINNAT